MIGPTSELVPGAINAAEMRFLADALAFEFAAYFDMGLSRRAYDYWCAASSTDNFTWRGECRAVLEGNYWRGPLQDEPSKLIWTVPALVPGNVDGIDVLEAVDIVTIDPMTGAWGCMTGAADTLPAIPAPDFGLTFRPDPMSWIAAATTFPPAVTFLNTSGWQAEQLLTTADFAVRADDMSIAKRWCDNAELRIQKRVKSRATITMKA